VLLQPVNVNVATDSVVDLLAEREMQVFELTGHGLSTRQIAERLHIDVKTVETYRARIKEKLVLKDSSELLQLAIQWQKEK
jgi:DNA-binding CsgD family transcriptional regulator